MALFIRDGLAIPDAELSFETARSGGPGGQNVNKVETKVVLLFDLERSPTLAEAERALLAERLRTRIAKDGVLRVTSQRHRTQAQNRAAAIERFVELVREALRPRKPRRPTRVTKSAKAKRLQGKKLRGAIKRERGRVEPD
jgi:ribosome-associated protein